MIYFLHSCPFVSMALTSENKINARTNIKGSWGLKSTLQKDWKTDLEVILLMGL